MVGVSTDHLADTVILSTQAGTSQAALAAGQMLIDATTAKNDDLSVGSWVRVKFALTGTSTIRIGGIFEPNALIGHYLVGGGYFLSHFLNPLPIGVLLKTDGRSAMYNAITTPPPLSERRCPDQSTVRSLASGRRQQALGHRLRSLGPGRADRHDWHRQHLVVVGLRVTHEIGLLPLSA